jgi:hypothetical protein
MRNAGGLFFASIFASAFLIFGVQPMVGKHVLPWFGGVPSVWMMCLAFYQTALFVGYAYAWFLAARIPPRWQTAIHGSLFLASLALLPVLPGVEWKPDASSDSSLRILAMLSANVALPFTLLAATGPLLQVWFARALPERSPYPLYAVSNLGSLIGLLSFPLLVEPNVGLSVQSRIWSWGFGVTGVLVLACGFRAATRSPSPNGSASSAFQPALPSGSIALWILLPASAVMMFMGVTNQLCMDVASVPFLWMVPLSIYLITLVLCFGSERVYLRGVFLPLAVASVAWLIGWAPGGYFGPIVGDSLGAAVARYCAALFFGCMVAHGELYRLRPGLSRLPDFYLCIAGGGALGGLFVGLIAPRIFDGYYELPLGVAWCWALVLIAITRSRAGVFAGRWRSAAWAGLALVSTGALALYVLGAGRVEPGTLAVERNFFGILRVIETHGRAPSVELRHGTTRHGLQYTATGARHRPTSYYGQPTGIGVVLEQRMRIGRTPARLGVVGLGIGTLAAYGRKEDRIVFYEIDPQVVRLARDSGQFTYLADSKAEIEIVTGDARLSLETELAQSGSRGFDVLVIDAFTSDAVPLHLLTAEAFRVYVAQLATGGVLAVHVSNRNLELTNPVARLAREVGLYAFVVVNLDSPQQLAEASDWVVLVREPAYFEVLEAEVEQLPKPMGRPRTRTFRLEPEGIARTPLWTDDFSNVLPQLRRSGKGREESVR